MKTRFLLACMLLGLFIPLLHAQDADSVDVAIIIDRSMSMEGEKLTAAKNGASQLIQLLELGDEVTVVGYSNHGHAFYPMSLITYNGQINAATSAVNGIDIGEYTSIGDGVYCALVQCNDLTYVNPIVGFVLLSDGLENVTPLWTQVRPYVPSIVNIYTIGLGTTVASLMSQIASYTGGLYFNGNTGNLNTIMQQIYDVILCDGTRVLEYCDTFANDDTSTITVPITVDPSMHDVTFNLIWRHDDVNLGLRLIAPDGTVYDPDYLLSTDVEHSAYPTQEFFRFQNTAMPGTWTAMIDCDRMAREDERFTFEVSGGADLKLHFAFDQTEYEAGDAVGLLVDIFDSGVPVNGAEVNAIIERNDGSTFEVPLVESPFEISDRGRYSARFTTDETEEIYTVHITASGETENGPFTRMTMCSQWVGPQTTDDVTLPIVTNLSASNFPNPFNPTTTISYSLPAEGSAKLDIYNVRGQRVRSLVNDTQSAGSHQAVWNGNDDNGIPVASGCYFYRLQSNGETVSGRMLLLK